MKTLKERFDEKYEPITETGCWIWTAAIDKKGYGRVSVKTDKGWRSMLAHRLSYKIHMESISDDLCVCHSCDTPACVNPDHLFLGTNKDNTDDMMKREDKRVILSLQKKM